MFHSRNPVYRNPTGAVKENTQVHFKITVPRDLACSAARMVVINDGTGEHQTLGMFWCGMNGDNFEWWECDFTPASPGLYFYNFNIDTWRGNLTVNRDFGGHSRVGGSQSLWQLTVYEKTFQTPEWLAGGVMYQIFPDRFYCSGEEKQNVPRDRKMHRDWLEQPDWAPNEQGKITNTDYFGGDLKGIEEKLPYLKSLGVTCLYLNPIFEAHSNHRYDTADYSKIDPLLGREEDFRSLCKAAGKMGIRVLLDGVFSHTGSDSVYFNREGRYGEGGAYRRQDSPYYPWYTFRRWPDDYDCWWNFITLPNVNECNPDYDAYINGEGGIIQKWLDAGASGWRLDVADELPDVFLDHLRKAAKEKNPDAVVLGEVWEDASNKVAYSYRRRYLLGQQLDSVMNYPFRNAVMGFLTGAKPADMMEAIQNILENYPPEVIRVLMNHIGTHDTERALTVLAGEPLLGHGRQWQSSTHLSAEQRIRGLQLMRLAAAMQFTLPGVPCVYYGDEAGMEGYRDPFNRACYPWGREDQSLIEWYRALGALRANHPALREGEFIPMIAGDDCMAYLRQNDEELLFIALNRAPEERKLRIPTEWENAEVLLGDAYLSNDGLFLASRSCTILHKGCGKPS